MSVRDPGKLSIADISEGLEKGSFTSRELVSAFLEEIAERDSAGRCINSVLEINPDALDIAASLDREYAQKGPRALCTAFPCWSREISTRATRCTRAPARWS